MMSKNSLELAKTLALANSLGMEATAPSSTSFFNPHRVGRKKFARKRRKRNISEASRAKNRR